MADNYDLVRVSYKNFNRNVFITWGSKKETSFVVFDRNKTMFAKIYKFGENWFIFYTKLGYRVKVNSFTEAIDIIEKETDHCWKSTTI